MSDMHQSKAHKLLSDLEARLRAKPWEVADSADQRLETVLTSLPTVPLEVPQSGPELGELVAQRCSQLGESPGTTLREGTFNRENASQDLSKRSKPGVIALPHKF